MDQTQLEEQRTQKLMSPDKYSHIYTSKMNMTISKLTKHDCTTHKTLKPDRYLDSMSGCSLRHLI
jgi:hypothetical protein